jgi:capsular polysaccharide export protein
MYSERRLSLPLSSAGTIAFSTAALSRAPHLPAFWPECRTLATGAELLALEAGEHQPARLPPGVTVLRYAPGPFRAPGFGRRQAAVTLLMPDFWVPEAAETPDALEAAALVAEARIGGEPGLPDPGAAGLRLPRRAAMVVLDPCDPARLAAGQAALAMAAAAGRPVLLARDPAAPAARAPVLRPPQGARWLPARLSAWTLLDLADELFGASEEMTLLAAAAGVKVGGRVPRPGPRFAALLAATRCADPFLRRPWSFTQAATQLADWNRAQAENRPVTVCLGMSWWKRERVAALFARADGTPGFTASPARALRQAKARHDRGEAAAIATWARAAPPGYRAACAAAGVRLLTVEDGFVRSRGLGARFLPGASYAVDGEGTYYDPAIPSALERILTTAEFPPALLARAAALRQAIVGRGVTKYNLSGEAPRIPPTPGRARLLVPGQVEDDASVRLGGGAIQGNLALLRAVRAAHPEAYIIYKPHPDLEAGFRKGHVAAAELAAVADLVVARAPINGLLGQVDALHTLTSLSGFEALLRGVPVVTWGRPFYAGWGLTEDRNPPPRRGRQLELDALVAATLILFPRQVDPVTELPCPPEVILERLGDPAAWKTPRLSLYRGVEGWVRSGLGRLRR